VTLGSGLISSKTQHGWDLITHLVAREFRLRYKQALLGWAWAIASPLARLAVLTFLFTRVVPLGIENYAVFVFAGLIAWQWFSSGVMSATTSAVDRKELLFRPGVPRAVVPTVSVLVDGLDYLAAFPVLLLFLWLTQGVPLTAVLVPVVLALQFLFTLGLGFMLCSANVYFRDVHLFVGVATLLGWYLTPVFYQPRMVPDPFRWIVAANPMAHLLSAYRSVLIYGRLPTAGSVLLLTLVCGGMWAAGLLLYRRTSPTFVDEL
jgi:lipopolysaccharide transport system permease protein